MDLWVVQAGLACLLKSLSNFEDKCGNVLLQESYAMLHDFEVSVPQEENNKVDSLRYSFQKLMVIAVSCLTDIMSINIV